MECTAAFERKLAVRRIAQGWRFTAVLTISTRKSSTTIAVRRKRRHQPAAQSYAALPQKNERGKNFQNTDDKTGSEVCAKRSKIFNEASTTEKSLGTKTGGNIDAAAKVGQLVAERAQKAGISSVVYDRGGYVYHGRVKALLDATRAAGLNKNESAEAPVKEESND